MAKIQNETAANKAEFFSGIKFQYRLDTFEIRILVPRREIVHDNKIYPNWHL